MNTEIINEISNYDSYSLEKLMKISTKLAILNVDRFQKWTKDLDTAKQALLAFKGEVFRGMDVGSLSHSELFYANEHLRILSGLYGVLRPFDGINEYRLEMGTKLKVNGLKDLYEFWGDRLYNELSDDDHIILNLASKEYAKNIERYLKKEDYFVTCIFGEVVNGKVQQKGTMAKMARGEMVRYMAENQIKDVKEIQKFHRLGYVYHEELSGEKEYVFLKEGE